MQTGYGVVGKMACEAGASTCNRDTALWSVGRALSIAGDIAPGGWVNPLPNAKECVDVGLEVPSAVPAGHEAGGADVDVLVAHMVRPVGRRYKIEKRRRPPGRTSWARGDGPVSAIRQTHVGDVAPDEGVRAFAVDVDDPLQTAPNRVLRNWHLDRT